MATPHPFAHLRRTNLAVLLATTLLQFGCQTTESAREPNPERALIHDRIQNDEALTVIRSDIKVPFATGELKLTDPGWITGYGAASRAGLSHDELKQLYAERLWPLVVNLIAKQGFGDDLHYYLLGYSAEQLGYPEAAVVYYEKSIEQSGRALRGKCLACMSITFPDRSVAALERVKLRLAENPNNQ